MCCTDWIEHVAETNGEPYLQTPENEMSLLQLWNLDIAALALLGLVCTACLLRLFLRILMQSAQFILKRDKGLKNKRE